MSNEIDVMQLAADVMERRGYAVNRRDACIEHPDSGLVMRPTLVESYPSPPLFRTVSVVTTSHPRLIPAGVFEYQHSVGKNVG